MNFNNIVNVKIQHTELRVYLKPTVVRLSKIDQTAGGNHAGTESMYSAPGGVTIWRGGSSTS